MRASGILLPIFSLPSPYGIGTLGKEAHRFVDFLSAAGQKYWQILPLGPTSYGDSPYQSFSTFAGNPYFIDLELLVRDGLLTREECAACDFGSDPGRVDYKALFDGRFGLLRKAYGRGFLRERERITRFEQENAHWLPDYALFMALKYRFAQAPVQEWEADIRSREPAALEYWRRELKGEVEFWTYLQYLFFRQWRALKGYANRRGIKIIGDIPIYVALDSADVWANPQLFSLHRDLTPVEVAGCPPDAFSKTGQLWGNPLYDWEALQKQGYGWWIERVRAVCSVHDVVRIDHFRGFESYYAIPATDETAEHGIWRKGPGIALFEAIRQSLGEQAIIAEDLGLLTEAVHELLRQSGYPGMKVLQFAFDPKGDSDYLPHNFEKNCVVYTGTHDNDTVRGWFETSPAEQVRFCKRYLHLNHREGYTRGFIRAGIASSANLCVTQMQDWLGTGSEGRINIPSTLGGNWCWRLQKGELSAALAREIRAMTRLYGR